MKDYITAITLDDEEDACKSLQILLGEIDYIRFMGYAMEPENGFDLYISVKPDLVFMDIEMPVENGFSFLNRLRKLGYNPPVIFVTGYKEYALNAFDYNVFGYLLKPIDRQKLKEILVRFRDLVISDQSLEDEKLEVNFRSGTAFLPVREIFYLKAEGNYTQIRLTGNRTEYSSRNLGKFSELNQLMHFKRIGRSYLVNPKFLYKVEDQNKKLTLVCGSETLIIQL